MSNEPRVLVIEDHDAIRVMLFTVLRNQPVAVDTAATTAEAIEHIEECDYALILLDLDLPADGANEFIARFQEVRPDSNAFIIGLRDPSQPECSVAAVKAILDKPIELSALAELVRECAIVIPPAPEEESCPPAESEVHEGSANGPETTN